MAHIVADRVQETTIGTGTSNLTLAGAATGFRAFSAVCANNDTFFYCIRHQSANEWEIGLGTYVSATPAIARTTLIASSTGSAINFTSGTKDVFITSPAITQSWGSLSPAQITSDQNDYNPTGLEFANRLRLSGDRPYRQITGVAGGFDGRRIEIEVTGTYPILFRHESSSSSAANRLAMVTDRVLFPGETLLLEYDGADSRWEPSVLTDQTAWIQPVTLFDDFLNSGEVGESGTIWSGSASGTAVYTTTRNAAQGRLGLIDLQTGTTSGNNVRLHWGVSATNVVARCGDVPYWAWLVSIPTITSIIVRLGVGTDVSSFTGGTDGLWFEFDPAGSANWRCFGRASSATSGAQDTTIAVTAGNYYLLECFYYSTSDVRFFVNGVQRATLAANIPAATTNINVGCLVQTATTAARNLVLDAFKARIAHLGQRWT